jgi:adenylate cyclase
LLGIADGEAEKPPWAALYETALTAYRARDFGHAASLFERVLAERKSDRPAQTMLDRCRDFLQSPPGKDWEATSAMKVK